MFTLDPNKLAKRGVHFSPVLSRNGNPELVSVTRGHRELERCEVPPGSNAYGIAMAMLERLDDADPVILTLFKSS